MSCANKAAALGMSISNITVANGVQSLGIGLGIGTPQQLVALWPSVADDTTFVYNAAECTSSTDYKCIGYYGGVYNSTASSTYENETLTTWNGSLYEIESSGYNLQNLVFFQDKIAFGSSGTVDGFPMLMEQKGKSAVSGLAIGYNSTFLDQAVSSGAAPSKNWGLWVGSRSITQPVSGALWLGGYDSYRTIGQLTSFTSPRQNCPTCVLVTGLNYVSPSGTTTTLFSNSSEALTVGMQPTAPYLNVPNDIYTNFVNIMTNAGAFNGWINGVATYKNDFAFGNISVTLQTSSGADYTTSIPAYEMFQFDRNTGSSGNLQIYNNTYKVDMFQNVSSTYGYIVPWGWPFLTMNYLVMDFDANQFKMAPARQGQLSQSNSALVQPLCSGLAMTSATPQSGPSSTASSAASASPSGSSSHSHAGAIAGGVVGGVAGLILIAVLVWFILRGKRREKALKDERDAAVAQGSEMGQRQDVMSQYTATSPTVVSEAHGGATHNEKHSINQWLSAQNMPQEHTELETTHPASYPPSSPTFTNTHPSHLSQASATMNEPFEMPAYQYK